MMTTGNADTNNSIASVASLFLGFLSLAPVLGGPLRQERTPPDPAALADDLALTLNEQWLDEAKILRLRSPRVLPLAWSATTRNVADLPDPDSAGPPGTAARVLRMRLNGRLEGRFETVIRQLAQGYEQLPNRRLVVLGEPGAGKTALAILLTLGMLAVREVGGPVPVLLPVSSWDPVRESLDDWIVRTLAVPYYNGREEIPRTLMGHGLLLPVLDGLDEIPEPARRSAVRAINHVIGAERPIAVTCRAAEYEDLIRGGAPVLRRAPVIEVSPVLPEDVIAYLGDMEWPAGIGWDAVFDHLRSEPGSPVATALSTPLMMSAAQIVYQRSGAEPAELLDTARFDCRYAVEDHLTDRLVDAAYAPVPLFPGQPDDGLWAFRGRWTAVQARQWLTFLAVYLHDHRERDLAWWRMSQRLLSLWVAPCIGIGVGLVLMIVSAVWAVFVNGATGDYQFQNVLAASSLVGGGFAVLATVVCYGSADPAPGRVSLAARGSWRRLRRGFRTGLALTSVSVVPVLIGFAVIYSFSAVGGLWSFSSIELYCEMLMVSAAMAAVVGLALAAHNWLDAPPTRAGQAGPGWSVIQDRRSSLVGALVAGTVIAATGLLGWTAGTLSGSLISGALTDWPGWPGDPDLSLLAEYHWDLMLGHFGHRLPLVLGLAVLLPATVFALLVLLTRAWPRFVLVRLLLAVRGRLPWRLMSFLADARERELLRQSGGMYQFRHIRLQETLAAQWGAGPAVAGPPAGPAGRPVGRRLVLTAGAASSVAAVTAFTGPWPKDMCRTALAGHESAVLAVAFQPGGQLLASAGADGTVRLWGNRANSILQRWPVSGTGFVAAPVLAFRPDGRGLAIATGYGAVELWDVKGRRRLTSLTIAKSAFIRTLAFHPGGRILAVLDSQDGIYLWAGDSYQQIQYVVGESVRSVAFNPSDGTLAAVNSAGGVQLYTVSPLRKGAAFAALPSEKSSTPGLNGAVAFSRHGGLLAAVSGNGLVRWWDTGTAQETLASRLRWDGPLAFSPADPTVALAGAGGTVRLWRTDAHDGFITLTGHTGRVNAMAFDATGRLLATASDDRTVRLWNVPT
jgi:hypothetical protein